MNENKKTRMTRNRQTKGKKGLEVVGKHDLTGLLPCGKLRMTLLQRYFMDCFAASGSQWRAGRVPV
jgi:hypothetical protein